MTTGLLAIPSVRGKKDAIVSKFCGLSCGELINEAAFQADVRFMMFNSMLVQPPKSHRRKFFLRILTHNSVLTFHENGKMQAS